MERFRDPIPTFPLRRHISTQLAQSFLPYNQRTLSTQWSHDSAQRRHVTLLPDELLLQITFNTGGDNRTLWLLNLALSHRAFRQVVHETLVRNAVVPVRSIPYYIALLSHHPSWANSITELELRDDSKQVKKLKFNSEAMQMARESIVRLWTGQEEEKARCGLEFGNESPLLWTPLLFAALPNAKTLRVAPASDDEIHDAYRLLLRHWECAEYFMQPLISSAQTRLEVLTVRASRDIYDPIGVSHLTNLGSLTVDGECLRPADFREFGTHGKAMLARTHPTGSLPLHLETLHVYGDERTMPWQWLRELQWHQVQNRFGEVAFTHLKVRLFFNIPCHTLARFLVFNFEPDVFQNIDVLMLLYIWEQSPVDFESLFRDPKDACDAFMRPKFFTRGILPEEFLTAQTQATEDLWYKLAQQKKEKMRPGESICLHK